MSDANVATEAGNIWLSCLVVYRMLRSDLILRSNQSKLAFVFRPDRSQPDLFANVLFTMNIILIGHDRLMPSIQGRAILVFFDCYVGNCAIYYWPSANSKRLANLNQRDHEQNCRDT